MKTITKVEVVEVEKRRTPSKHYVYVIFVTWSDGGTYVIYRRYSRFFDFQSELLDKFPIEGGTIDPESRIIPFLPGKIIFGRSHIRDVAVKRLGSINDYCKAVIALPSKISQCEEVLNFFEVEPEDLDPPKTEEKKKKDDGVKKVENISHPKNLTQYRVTSDYEKQDRGEIDLEAGMMVEVAEKSETGWWFVNSDDAQGWVPSTYLEPADGSTDTVVLRAKPGQEEKYICIEMFQSGGDDEISLDKGAVVDVLEKNLAGWWLVRHQGVEGFAPATYLNKTEDQFAVSLAHRKSTDVEIITNLADVSNIMKGDSPRNSLAPPPETTQPITKGLDISSKVQLKSRSLERGGRINPPPRQSIRMSKNISSPTHKTSHYVTIAEFIDTVGDGISFKEGQSVQVNEKTDSGWWFVNIDGNEGWVPSSYIQSESHDQLDNEDPEVYSTIDEAEISSSDWSSDEADQSNVELRKPSKKGNSIADAIKDQLRKRRSNSDPESKSDEKKEKSKVPDLPTKPPKAVGITPKPSGIGAKLSGVTPKPSGITPKPSGIGAKLSGVTPKPSGITPNPSGITPNPSGITPKPSGITPKPSGITPKSSGIPPKTEPQGDCNQGLANILKSKFKNRNNNFSTDSGESTPSHPTKPILPKASSETRPPLRPKSTARSKTTDGVGVISLSNKNQNKPVPKIPCQTVNGALSVKPSWTSKPGINTRPTSGVKPTVGTKPTLGLKPAFGTRPTSNTKPVLPNKQPIASKPTVNKTGLGVPPPKLPVKPSNSSSVISDTNNNDEGEKSGPGVHGLAAALQSKFENKNSAQGLSKFENKNSAPGLSKFENKNSAPGLSKFENKNSAPGLSKFENKNSAGLSKFESNKPVVPVSGTKNITSVASKFENRGHVPSLPKTENKNTVAIASKFDNKNNAPPKLPGKPNLPTKKKVENTQISNKSHEIEKPKANVGNLVSALSGKLNFGGPVSSAPSSDSVGISNNYSSVSKDRNNSVLNVNNGNNSVGNEKKYIVMESFVAESDQEINIHEGDEVEMVEETDSGWWMVKHNGKSGWVPSAYLVERRKDAPVVAPPVPPHASSKRASRVIYRTCAIFTAENDGELGFDEGETVDVVDKTDADWWLIKIGNDEGWAPRCFISQVEVEDTRGKPPATPKGKPNFQFPLPTP